MTAIATPLLDQVSEDVTLLAKVGSLPPIVGREAELHELFQILAGGHAGVLLIGEPGVGTSALLEAVAQHMISEEVPSILIQMIMVGEETGSLGPILKTMTDFYKREVDDAVDTLVGLIEPTMIVVLGLGVGILLVSILMPIYNLAGSIS